MEYIGKSILEQIYNQLLDAFIALSFAKKGAWAIDDLVCLEKAMDNGLRKGERGMKLITLYQNCILFFFLLICRNKWDENESLIGWETGSREWRLDRHCRRHSMRRPIEGEG